MKNVIIVLIVLLVAGGLGYKLLSGTNAEPTSDIQVQESVSESSTQPTTSIKPSSGFVEKLAFESEGNEYTLGPIPAHFWKLNSTTTLSAEHYNGSNPFAWASDMPSEALLYEVDGTIGSCSNGYLADKPSENGYVHFHGSNEDSGVGFWLKHTAVTPFVWDGPPGNPGVGREVPAGVDLKFANICEFPAVATGEDGSTDSSIDASGASENVSEINLTVEQWKITPSEVRVKEGDTVKMTITSLDVTHGFAINEFGVNETIPAGETISFEFVADKKGTYTQYCSVICGEGHSGMVGDFIVE